MGDSARIAVHRRYRRAKTDRLEVPKLITMLLRHAAGEKQVWSVVRVPNVVDAERRQRHRDLLTPKHDRTRVIKRRKGLLAGAFAWGCPRLWRRHARRSARGKARRCPRPGARA